FLTQRHGLDNFEVWSKRHSIFTRHLVHVESDKHLLPTTLVSLIRISHTRETPRKIQSQKNRRRNPKRREIIRRIRLQLRGSLFPVLREIELNRDRRGFVQYFR